MMTRILTAFTSGCAGLLCAAIPGVVINEIHFDPSDKRALEFVELHNSSTNAVPLAGWTLEKFTFPLGAVLQPGGHVVVAKDPQVFKKEFGFEPFGPLPGKLSSKPEKLVLRDSQRRVRDEVRYHAGFPWPTAAAGGGASMERIHPSLPGGAPGSWRSSGFLLTGEKRAVRPTPGKINSVWATNAPPSIEMVTMLPATPRPGELVTVFVNATDPDGVRSLTLNMQLVEPGAYLRKSDPAYATSWRDLPLRDDGMGGDSRASDGIFTAIIPAEMQRHRRLIRYRVTATDVLGLSAMVPYADDDCPNFAYFCYETIPAWSGASQPGKTPALAFSPEFLGTIPVYHLLAAREDVERSQWDGGFNKRKSFGTLIYDGRVYDHVQFNNRGQASTYVAGKNKWAFHFNRTREFQSRDLWGRHYSSTWNNFNMDACASPWVQVNRGMAGMDEAVSYRAYELAGVPSPNVHWVHFRVIDAGDEAPASSQYDGDLWGLYLVVQEPDGAWMKDRGLIEGNTYSPETGRKHIAPGTAGDNRDWDQFMGQSRGNNPEGWWRQHLDLPAYYSFHAINRVVGNVDLRHGGNHYFYANPNGHWAPVPWDLDMMFIPRTHWPGIIDQTRCLDHPNLRREYQNRARELLDLFCSDAAINGGQVGQLVDELASVIRPAGHARNWAELDMAMWNFHPRTGDKGAFYRNPAQQGMMGGGFERRLATPDFAGFCKFITDYSTDSRPQKNYLPNDGNALGYGFGFLWHESRDEAIPARPTLRYVGAAGHPANLLAFESSPFTDPQGAASFAAVQWRVGRLTAPGLSGHEVSQPRRYEIEPYWTSDESNAVAVLRLPANLCQPRETYRVRVRHKDNTGRWSHWSLPAQFVPSVPR